MREQNLLLAGLLAMCAVSTAALARLIAVWRIFRRQRGYYSTLGNSSSRINGNSASSMDATSADGVASSRILVPSLVFHVLVFLCLVVEVPVYACRYAATFREVVGLHGDGFNSEGRALYALHLSSFLLLFLAFCVIVTLWSEVAVFEPNEWTVLMNRSVLVLCVCYLVVTTSAVSVCLGLGSVKYFFSSFAFRLFCAYSIAALLLLGSCFLVLGCLLQRRIFRVLATDSCTATLTARVVRLNVVMLACFVCFCWRAFMLAALVQVQAEGEIEHHFGRGWKRWEWDMRMEWALHVIPCVAMLYLMRKAGEPDSSAQRDVAYRNERSEFGDGEAESCSDGKETARQYGSYG